MNAAEHLARDATRAWLLAQAKPLAILLAIVILPLIGYCHGRSVERTGAAYAAKKDSVKAADRAVAAAVETVKVYVAAAAEAKAQSDRADADVVILNDSTLSVHIAASRPAVTVAVPPAVTKDLLQLRETVDRQAAAIMRLQRLHSADSLASVARDHLLAASKPRRSCSIGAAGGQTYNAHGSGLGVTLGVVCWAF